MNMQLFSKIYKGNSLIKIIYRTTYNIIWPLTKTLLILITLYTKTSIGVFKRNQHDSVCELFCFETTSKMGEFKLQNKLGQQFPQTE